MTPTKPPPISVPWIGLGKIVYKNDSERIRLQMSLSRLESYRISFFYDVSLFNFGTLNMQREFARTDGYCALDAWREIALRDGAVTLFNFGKTLEVIKNSISLLVELRSNFDHDKRREVKRIFDKHFPDFAAMRHAVTHAAELSKNEKTQKKNTYKGAYVGAGFIIGGDGAELSGGTIRNGNQLTMTIDGKMVSYVLSIENFYVINEVTRQTMALFLDH